MSNFMKKKTEKSEYLELLHCRQMERQTKQNLWNTFGKVDVQLVLAPHKHYEFSVAVWLHIHVRLWVE